MEINEINRNYDFDKPDSIDWDLLNKCLDQVLEGKPFNVPVYSKHLK